MTRFRRGQTGGMDNPRDLRVGDAEREHVFDILQRAVGRGLIDADEFSARADTAMAAATRGELNAVLVDLPGAHATPDRLELVANCSSAVERRGAWVVPHELAIRTRWNRAALDFTQARFTHPEVRITLDVLGGPVELTMPEGATVTIHNLSTTWGAGVQDERETVDSGLPYAVINGSIRLAPLVIR